MGGQLLWREPLEHRVLLSDVEVVRSFNACGWLWYCLNLMAFDDEVASEFSRTFMEGEALVWGLKIIAIEERIVEVTTLPLQGEHYPNEHDARVVRVQFSQPNDPPIEITKHRYKRMSIPSSYKELEMHIIRYFTCEGRFSNLHAHHFKMLSHIRHNLEIT